jgi:hypothetical protein
MLRTIRVARLGAVAAVSVLAAAAPAFADGDTLRARMLPTNEVPALSSTAVASFVAKVEASGDAIEYRLSYAALEGTVTQAHLHLGQKDVNGGIAVWLCGNIATTPAGVQACPPAPATVTGRFTASDIVGPAAQGLTTGEWDELLGAIRAGLVYANVHSTMFPGGEARGQVTRKHRHR